jgi:cytoskeletal protein RodZ
MQERHAFGNYLRRERELRQIPLSEVAAATKIPLHTLQHLEDGVWDDLPAEVFVRGFVRSYARHVGLPPEDACRRFTATMDELRHRTAIREIESVGESATDVGGRRRFGLALFVIIMLIIATITLSLLWRRGASAETHAASLERDSEISRLDRRC